jgi:hypothetical protein
MTAPFSAGRHFFSVTLARGSSLSLMKAERKKESAQDYIDTLRGLGFDAGKPGEVVPRSRAKQAEDFIKGQSASWKTEICLDIVLPSRETGDTGAVAGQTEAPLQPTQTVPPNTGNPPAPPPVVASPPPGVVSSPSPSPTPRTSPSPPPSSLCTPAGCPDFPSPCPSPIP